MKCVRPALSLTFGLVLVPLCAFGCASAEEAPLEPRPAGTNRMEADRAPTPFSAEELREGCGDGRRMRVALHKEGEAKRHQVTEFLVGDEKHARMRGWLEDADGKRTTEMAEMSVPWRDLQRHASFPSILTRIEEESIEVPAGRFECWRYTVTREKAGQVQEDVYWFAKELPGPPIRREVRMDGKRLEWAEMVEHVPAGAR